MRRSLEFVLILVGVVCSLFAGRKFESAIAQTTIKRVGLDTMQLASQDQPCRGDRIG